MTTHTSWYPLSFSNDKGKLVELECDFYGYQTMAGYKDLCHSLSDGVAIVEQEFEIGDAISVSSCLLILLTFTTLYTSFISR